MASVGLAVCIHSPVAPAGLRDGMRHRAVRWPAWHNQSTPAAFGLAYVQWVRTLSRSLHQCVEDGDLLHFHGATVGALHSLPESFALRSVVNPHGMEEFVRGNVLQESNRVFIRRMTRRGAATPVRVVATDRRMVDDVARTLGRRKQDVHLIPNSVDVKALSEMTLQAPTDRRSPATTACFVSVGRLVHNKGFDIAAEALRTLSEAGSLVVPVQWLHFGTGPATDAVERILSGTVGVTVDVVSGASDAEVQMQLATSDLVLVPSRYEGSSLVTLEAMAHGGTVVAMPVGGIPDKVIDGVTGFLADDITPSAFAAAILRALHSDRSTVGANAKSAVEAHFSEAQTSQQYLELYRQLFEQQAAESEA
jgi:glycogen(starch) synthase